MKLNYRRVVSSNRGANIFIALVSDVLSHFYLNVSKSGHADL